MDGIGLLSLVSLFTYGAYLIVTGGAAINIVHSAVYSVYIGYGFKGNI